MAKRPSADAQNHASPKGRPTRKPARSKAEYAPFVGYVSWNKDANFLAALEQSPNDLHSVLDDLTAACEQHGLKLTAFWNDTQEAWNVGLTGYLAAGSWPGLCLNVINVEFWRAIRGLHALHFTILAEDWSISADANNDTW